MALSMSREYYGGVWIRRYWKCGPLALDATELRAVINGREIPLNEDEFNALYLLVQREGEILTFEELYKAVWEPLDDTDLRAVARAGMGRLTQEVNEHGGDSLHMETPPEGYKLIYTGGTEK